MEPEHAIIVEPIDENQDLDDRLNDIDIHEVEEEDIDEEAVAAAVPVEEDGDSTDSGEGSIILVNEDEGRVEEILDADDGVVLDDRNSDDMDTDDGENEANSVNNVLVDENRVGGNHPLIRFTAHTGGVFWSDIDPKDGVYAVTGSEDDRALIWSLNSGELLLECTNHVDSVTHVGFSFDSTYVATGDMAGLIQVWKLFDPQPIWSERLDELQWLLWHKYSNVLIAAQKNGEIFIWRIPSGQCKVLPGQGTGTECAMLTSDGERIIVGYNDHSVKVFNLRNESVIACYKPQVEIQEAATDIDILGDESNFAVGFTDGVVLIGSSWSSKTLAELDTKTKVESVRFVAQNVTHLLAVGSSKGVEIYDFSKKVLRHSVECSAINRMLYDLSRNVIYAGGISGEIYVISCLSGSIIYYFVGHRANILHISMSRDKCKMLTASDDSRCNVYDLIVLNTLTH